MAVDPDGGIDFASDKIMRTVARKNGKLSTADTDGAWSSPYDSGRQPPTVKNGIPRGTAGPRRGRVVMSCRPR